MTTISNTARPTMDDFAAVVTYGGVSFSPDGKYLAVLSDTLVQIWNVGNGVETAVLRGHRFGVLGLAWSADNSKLATSGHDGTVRVWEPSQGNELLSLRVPGQRVNSVAWSPDGRFIAFSSNFGGGPRNIAILSLLGGQPTRISFARSEDGQPTWSPVTE